MVLDFVLSDGISKGVNHYDFEECIAKENVKEFIRRLKEISATEDNRIIREKKIDKLAGEKLI